MHDIKSIRAAFGAFHRELGRRGVLGVSDELISSDSGYRTNLAQVEAAKQVIAQASARIGALRRERGGRPDDEDDAAHAEEVQQRGIVSVAKDGLETFEKRVEFEKVRRDRLLQAFPNLAADDVPDGLSETDNRVVHECGTKPAFDFAPVEHDTLALRLGYDPDQAAAVAGARFAVLKGPLARLHRALGQFMLDAQVANGFVEVVPPLLVLEKSVFGVGQLPKFEEDLFKTTDGRYLISTSEVSLTNLVREKILDADELPLRFTALTPCFRSEAGSAGRDTRGLIRQHQFEKVEMVSIVADQEAATAEHERMVGCAEGILDALGLAYRRMLLCAGDMGFAARKTYDLEVWLPGQGQYREISSVSDCGDFQARRMAARWKTRGQKGTNFVHTLNGSGLAVGRTLVAVLENYQQADGSVRVPEALVPWMGGVMVLEPS